MSSLFKVTKIEGKGLGCVAISDIKKGSLILSEKPKFCVETEERVGSSMWIKSLLKSFYQMSKADQHEYMTLHGKFIPNIEDTLRSLLLEIVKFEKNPENAEKILKICAIHFTHGFEDGFCLKMSRFNHSCQPNANTTKVKGQQQLIAIGNIKAGKEINLSYFGYFYGFRNRKYRRQNLLERWGFFCSCDLSEADVDIDAGAFEPFIQEAEKLFIDRQSAIDNKGISLGAQDYSLAKCKKEILCYKKLYKVGKDQNIQPSVSKGRDVPLSLCPFVPGQGQEQMSRDKITPQKPGKRRSKTEKGRSKTGK